MCVFGSHKCLPISWMCRKQTAVSHSSAESETISPDAGLRKMVHQLFNLGVRVKNTVLQKQPLDILSVINAMESFRFIQILTIVSVNPLTMFRPTFPTAVVQPHPAVIHMIPKGQSPKLEARHKNAQSRFGLVVWESEFGPFYSDQVRANQPSVVDILTKGMFATMQRHLSLHFWQIGQPYESNAVRSFSRTTFSCTAFAEPQTMAQMMTKAECNDKMWDQYSSKVFQSGRILGDIVTSEQLSNHEFRSTQDKRDFLAGVLFAVSAEGNILQIESSFQILRSGKVCETSGPFDTELSKMFEAEVHVFSDSLMR